MFFLLKLVVLFFCVQAGDGQWLHRLMAALDGRGRSGSGSGSESRTGTSGFSEEAAAVGREDRDEGSGLGVVAIPSGRVRRGADSPCGLRSVLLQVRDLGLGYDSDEAVLFKYCSGACPHVSSNHELTLANLLQSGALVHSGPWHHAPCCRPTGHEDMAFLDNNHRWHKVEKLSAAACACIG